MLNAIKSIFHKLFGDISVGTVARTICVFLALINQILVVTGNSVIPIKNETIEAFVTNGATIIATLIAWWKNNSFTSAAITADKTMRRLKGK